MELIRQLLRSLYSCTIGLLQELKGWLLDGFERTLASLERIISREHFIEVIFHAGTLGGYVYISLLIKFTQHYDTITPKLVAWWMGWVLYTAFIIFCYIIFRRRFEKKESDKNMRIRYALLAMRRFSTYTAQRITDVAREIERDATKIDAYNFNEFIRHCKLRIVRGIFYQISFGNTNLDNRFRVALLEPFQENGEEELRIVSYYNSERLRPKIDCMGKGFKIKEGTAGWAWHYKLPFCVSDVDEYIRAYNNLDPKPDFPDFIIDFAVQGELTHRDQLSGIKSIVCYPVVIRERTEEIFKAVISIDCDKADVLANEEKEEAKKLGIQLLPYIRLLSMVYSIDNLYKVRTAIRQ
jgi:hypothetical protein